MKQTIPTICLYVLMLNVMVCCNSIQAQLLEDQEAQHQISQSLGLLQESEYAALAQDIVRDCSFSVQQITQDTLFPFTITTPGLYCLGSNIGAVATNTVSVNNNGMANNASSNLSVNNNNSINTNALNNNSFINNTVFTNISPTSNSPVFNIPSSSNNLANVNLSNNSMLSNNGMNGLSTSNAAGSITFNNTALTASPAIIIQSNNVIIDMNGYVMKGSGPQGSAVGIINNGYSNVIIQNGTIASMGSCAIRCMNTLSPNQGSLYFNNLMFADNGIGIQLSRVNNIAITNCSSLISTTAIMGSSTGFYLQQVNYGLLKKVFTYQNNRGFYLNTTNNVIFKKCSASAGKSEGFNQQGSTLTNFIKCAANANNRGFYSINLGTTLTTDCIFEECQASNNTLEGFLLQGSHFSVYNCQANNNTNGFVLYGPNNLLLNSSALGNTQDGFSLPATNGTLLAATNAQIRSNTAIGNAVGFTNVTASNHFYSNFANNNFTGATQENFVGIPNVQMSPLSGTAINFTTNISE